MTCVSNEVGGNLISTARFVGVPMRELLDRGGVQPGAQQVFSTSEDGWTCSTPVDVLQDPDRRRLLAIGMNGEPLPLEHGFPVRMVVPGLYGYVSATKWVVDMELTTFNAPARTGPTAAGRAGPDQDRVADRRAAQPSTVKAGKVTLAGLAWAQNTGIDEVEVRLNGGAWQRAELSAEVANQAWRMWRKIVELGPGSYTAEVRATDRSGYTQTDHRADPVPDGATGWHSVGFEVG